MASQNRFAALSSEFKGEEKRRKKLQAEKEKKEALKIKKEEELKAKAEVRSETQGFAVSEGVKKAKAAAGKDEPGAYEIAMKEDKIAPKEHHYTGSNNPAHPFDRKSGTGRGKEVPKQGGGKGNWGKPEDDLKYQNTPEEEEKEVTESPVDEKKKGKKKGGKKNQPEKEEELDADGNALTYGEYKAIQAEKQKEGATKKPKEKKVYEKKQVKAPAETEEKKPEGEEAGYPKEKGARYQPKGYRAKKEENTAPVEEDKEAPKEVRAPVPAAVVLAPKVEEPKKIERAPFIMKEDDFPTL